MKRPFLIALALASSLSLSISVPARAADEAVADPVEAAKQASENNPSDAQLKYLHAEALRKAGKLQEAVREYLAVTEINPTHYLAYHQLILCSPDQHSLNEAIKRLTFLLPDKSKDLMLRVALSELLECQGHYYQASKVLVDLVYENAVPPKFVTKVNGRIRYLQVKARSEHNARKVQETHNKTVDTTPLPLPEENIVKGLSASRLEKSQEVDGFGHAVLQH